MKALAVRDLAMSFGGNIVLREVSFTLADPQICGLIGPNGAGKSTLTNILDGVHQPTGGAVLFGGERIDGLAPYEVARRGLGRTFQVSRAFQRMTVLENLLVPGHVRHPTSPRGRVVERAHEALRLLSIDHLADEQARALSGGQQKLLELARLVMLDPAILILDEPFAGVHPRLREHISGFIRTLRDDGKALIVIEHDMDAIFSLSERLLVLAQGALIADGDPAEVRTDPAVIEAYLGEADEAAPKTAPAGEVTPDA